MNTIHLISGAGAAAALQAALNSEQDKLTGKLFVLNDTLHLGPLSHEAGHPFSEMRSKFWMDIAPEGQTIPVIDDLERLMEISTALTNQESLQLWFWMAPRAEDVCAYFCMLHYLKKHVGKVYIVNINGLPFLDDNGKLFYPDNIAQLPVKEVVKAAGLSRQLSASEWETDGEEWLQLKEGNSGIRTFQGGKKLKMEGVDFYDSALVALCNQNFQKIHRIVHNAINKQKLPATEWFLQWRLRELASQGVLSIQKGEVKKAGGESVTESDAQEGHPGE